MDDQKTAESLWKHCLCTITTTKLKTGYQNTSKYTSKKDDAWEVKNVEKITSLDITKFYYNTCKIITK